MNLLKMDRKRKHEKIYLSTIVTAIIQMTQPELVLLETKVAEKKRRLEKAHPDKDLFSSTKMPRTCDKCGEYETVPYFIDEILIHVHLDYCAICDTKYCWTNQMCCWRKYVRMQGMQ